MVNVSLGCTHTVAITPPPQVTPPGRIQRKLNFTYMGHLMYLPPCIEILVAANIHAFQGNFGNA